MCMASLTLIFTRSVGTFLSSTDRVNISVKKPNKMGFCFYPTFETQIQPLNPLKTLTWLDEFIRCGREFQRLQYKISSHPKTLELTGKCGVTEVTCFRTPFACTRIINIYKVWKARHEMVHSWTGLQKVMIKFTPIIAANMKSAKGRFGCFQKQHNRYTPVIDNK